MRVATIEKRLETVIGERGTRFVEFLGVGATGVVVDLAITTSALTMTHYLLANLLGFLVAVTWNFGGNWYFVFDKPEGPIIKQYASYVGLHGATFGLRAVVLAALVEGAGAPIMLATVVGIGAAAVANYLGTERILEDGVEWFDAVAAVNSVAHAIYHSRLRQLLRRCGIYAPLYGWYMTLLASIYRDDVLEIEAGNARGLIYTERAPEVVSVLHTLEKEQTVIESFVDELNPSDTVWDVGANLGVYSVLAADQADYVAAIEPHPATATRCQENLNLNDANGVTKNIALGDKSDRVELELERNEIGTQTPALDDTLIDARQTIDVQVARGDELIVTGSLPAPDVVKIDVEGAEVEVLEGLEKTLKEEVNHVLVESHSGIDGVQDLLEGTGFDVEVVSTGSQKYYIGDR